MERKKIIYPIPDEKQEKRGWVLTVNGEVIPNVKTMELTNPRFGTISYGLTNGGWDAWAFEEIGGGGSVIVPYCIINDDLYIGVVKQFRDTQGGTIFNLPRGFLSPGENHFKAAQREAGEELRFNLKERFEPFLGAPGNPNSAFFVTEENGEKGVKFFSLKFKPEEMKKGEEPNTFVISPELLLPETKQGELIFNSVFLHWQEVARLGDQFTLAGSFRLFGKIFRRVISY